MLTKIAIIGGGAGGVAMCLKLYEQIREAMLNNNRCDSTEVTVEITVFEKSAKIGPGLPYSSPYRCHILNLPKKIMTSAFYSTALADIEPDVNDKRERLSNSYLDTDFPPRYVYGQFLSDLAEQIQKEAEKIGIAIEFRTNTEVINVAILDDKHVEIQTSTESLTANYVVFCTGNMQSVSYCELIGKKGYWHNAFNAKKELENFDRNKDVVIVGSRKTAVDVALQLFTEENLQGNVLMVSHSGLLPTVYTKDFLNYRLKYLPDYIKSAAGQPSLDELVKLLWKELNEVLDTPVDFESIARSNKDIDAVEWLDEQIKETDESLKPWQQVLISLFPFLQDNWHLLSLADQKVFMKKYYSIFMIYATGFPQEAAKKLRKLIQDGRVTVCGGLKNISSDEDSQFNVQFENGTSLMASQVFNATGAGHNILSLPLFKKMCQQGSIVPHPMGGISVCPESFCVLDIEGKENDRMFAIGELIRGVELLTSDIRRLTVDAKTVASSITRQMIATK